MLPCQRDRFSLPDDVHYLNCAYISPLPDVSAAAGRKALAWRQAPLDLEPWDMFEGSDRLRRLFARLVGAREPGRVAIVPSVSYGASLVASNLEPVPGQNLVLAGEQFPSNVYPWRRVAARSGARIRTVARPDGGGGRVWTDRILEAIDRDTALVALPQAHWTDGTLFRLEEVGRRARETGALFVVDGTQTVGAHPFDLEAVGADALFCAGYKWLLGPYTLGFAWLGSRLDDARPLEETWIGREGSEDFRRLVDYTDAYRPDAGRFDMGERSSFLLTPVLAASLELILGWGVEAVAEGCARLTGAVARGAAERGLGVAPAAGRASNLVGLSLPVDLSVDGLAAELARRKVHVSLRGDALRVAPHLYNDLSDVEALLEAVDAAR